MKNLLIILTLLTLAACNNDDDQPQNPIDLLPPATQTGENTFGCLINGEPFVVTNTNNQVAIYQQGQLQFGASGMTIILGEPLIINIPYSLEGSARYIVNPNPQLGCHYQFEDTYVGSITFSKIDQINYIISGVFEFSTVTEDCEVVIITDGRFDMQYIP